MRHTEAQADFILEMYAEDHPDEFKIRRAGEPDPLPAPEIAAQWEQRLLGRAHVEFFRGRLPSQAVLDRIAAMTGNVQILQQAAAETAKRP